jgi:leucyl aminopeptidase
MRVIAELKPANIRVVAMLAVVRNSIGTPARLASTRLTLCAGSECYVPDEVITARSGVRVLVSNTDAEGRMAMGDLIYLCHTEAKEVVRAARRVPRAPLPCSRMRRRLGRRA